MLALVAASSYVLFAQAPQSAPRDDAYVSTHRPPVTLTGDDKVPIKDDAGGRAEWMREVMGGDLTPEFMEALMAAADAQRAQYGPDGRGAIQVPTGGQWTNIGPHRSNWIQNGLQVQESDTGRIRTFLVHPTNPDVLYVLTSSGGLWKTTNFSQPRPAWRAMTDSILSTSGGGAAFGKNPQTIYLGTGDPFDPGVGGFAYKSTDGGQTWSTGIKLGASTLIPDVKVHTSGATDTVLMGTNGGLWRSANGGATYTVVLSGLIWSLARTSAGWIAARTISGAGSILVSTNEGATWSPIPNTGAGYSGAGRTTLAVGAPPNDNVVYAFAATAGNGAQKDLFRSTDGGLTWTALGLGRAVTKVDPDGNEITVCDGKTPINPNPDQPCMDVMGGQAFYNHMVLVDPTDPNIVYIGGQLSSAKSTDGGATWRIITNWLAQFGLPYVHADFHAAAFATLKGEPTILFGTDGGLFLSTDGGRSFSSQKNDGISSYLIYAMTGNPKHADDVLIGLQDDGTRWREGKTGTYNQVLGGDGFGVGWSQANDRVGLASIYYSFIVRDVTNPPSAQYKWRIGWNGIEEFFKPAWTYFNTSIATPRPSADPNGQTFFHRTRFKLYRTTNGAASWTCVMETPLPPATVPSHDCTALPEPPPPPAPPPPPPPRILLRAGSHPIGISPEDFDHFGVLANGGWFFWTTNGGGTWNSRNLATAAPPWPGFNATLAYASNSKLYVGNEAPIGTPIRVLKSLDGGATWASASTGLPAVPMTKLIVSPRDPSGNTLYAGTWLGVYETTNGGASWHLFGQGLPIVTVSDLYMPPDGSYLRVSTYGRGVWETQF